MYDTTHRFLYRCLCLCLWCVFVGIVVVSIILVLVLVLIQIIMIVCIILVYSLWHLMLCGSAELLGICSGSDVWLLGWRWYGVYWLIIVDIDIVIVCISIVVYVSIYTIMYTIMYIHIYVHILQSLLQLKPPLHNILRKQIPNHANNSLEINQLQSIIFLIKINQIPTIATQLNSIPQCLNTGSLIPTTPIAIVRPIIINPYLNLCILFNTNHIILWIT